MHVPGTELAELLGILNVIHTLLFYYYYYYY